MGWAPPSRGCGGRSYGVLQLDVEDLRVEQTGPFSKEHVAQGARVLQGATKLVAVMHPEWSADQKMRGGVAAFRYAAGAVEAVGETEQFSSDVFARADFYAGRGTFTP